MNTPIWFFFAFIVVLALIGVAAWLVRRFAGSRLGAHSKSGRMPRLAVIDAAAVDGRRRLVLVRRDNVEHLLMIGGPSDIVVEPNIVRAMPARDAAAPRAEPPRAPLPEPAWDGEPPPPEPTLPELPPRPARPAFLEEVRRAAPPPPPPAPERRAEPMPSLPPEPIIRSEPREPRSEPAPRMPRAEPIIPRASREPAMRPPRSERPSAPPPAPPPAAAPADVSADQNLADMAQRLEAALRRPAAEAAEPRVGAPSVMPDQPAPRPARGDAPPRAEHAAPAKTGFENLEDEMASLLGRPKSPS